MSDESNAVPAAWEHQWALTPEDSTLTVILSSQQPHPSVPTAHHVQQAATCLFEQLCNHWPNHPLFTIPYTQWEWEILLTDNEAIRALNRTHRQKDKATDVLSFPGLAFSRDMEQESQRVYPIQTLGSVVISVEWAETHAATCERSASQTSHADQVWYYLLDRLMHGLLHVLGQHHDTLPDYERVVMWQTHAVKAVLKESLP